MSLSLSCQYTHVTASNTSDIAIDKQLERRFARFFSVAASLICLDYASRIRSRHSRFLLCSAGTNTHRRDDLFVEPDRNVERTLAACQFLKMCETGGPLQRQTGALDPARFLCSGRSVRPDVGIERHPAYSVVNTVGESIVAGYVPATSASQTRRRR